MEIISRGSTWNFAHDTFFLMSVPLWDLGDSYTALIRTQEIYFPRILREVMCQVLHRFNLGNEIIPSISFIGIGNLHTWKKPLIGAREAPQVGKVQFFHLHSTVLEFLASQGWEMAHCKGNDWWTSLGVRQKAPWVAFCVGKRGSFWRPRKKASDWVSKCTYWQGFSGH